MELRRVLIWVALIGGLHLLLAACSSTASSPGDSWTAAYVAPYQEVWPAVLDVLADADYYVADSDRKKGRIRAESSARHRYQEVVLEVTLKERGEVVRINVQARSGPSDSPAVFKRLERAVNEFLADLETKMRS